MEYTQTILQLTKLNLLKLFDISLYFFHAKAAIIDPTVTDNIISKIVLNLEYD